MPKENCENSWEKNKFYINLYKIKKKNKQFQYVIGDCEPWCYDRKKSSIEFQVKDIYDQSACENQTNRSVK